MPSKRQCRCGAGEEKTPGKGDTPGFQKRQNAEVLREKKVLKLHMPRNHSRVNQTSLDLLQSWRGNCDIHILIYKGDPDQPDTKELSKVTDYVVAYSCKGNNTWLEERQTTKQMILTMQETMGDTSDLRTLCKKVLNSAAVKSLISKQEACTLLGQLPLTISSEYMENVSISKSKKIRLNKEDLQNTTILSKNANRKPIFHHLSLHQFYDVYRHRVQHKQPAIPQYIGISARPTFPVTKAYAQHVLLVYKKWHGKYPEFPNWKNEFDEFVRSKYCPISCKMSYYRALQRHFDKTKFCEPVAQECDHSKNEIMTEDEIAIILTGMGASIGEEYDETTCQNINKGLHYNWSRPPQVSLKNSYQKFSQKKNDLDAIRNEIWPNAQQQKFLMGHQW